MIRAVPPVNRIPDNNTVAERFRRLMTNRAMRFALVFGACFLFGICFLLTPPMQILDGQFSRSLVRISQEAIQVFGGHALVQGAILRAPSGFAVEMRDGCNAINVTLLLWSAVLAFPASWKMKALGMGAGSIIIQVLNIIRFVSLFYIGQYSMRWFDFAHEYLWESLLVLDTMVVFWLWVVRVSRSTVASHAST
jgi:exosortase H (IPTLxxWG-CTERM-specific)